MIRSQSLSGCGRYQYRLHYRWGEGAVMAWILLNPSKAEGREPTTIRCVNAAKTLGFGGITIVNRFAYRTRHPDVLGVVKDPTGPRNNTVLAGLTKYPMVVAGWGAHRAVPKFAQPLPDIPLWCLGVNRDGSPRHPLYAPLNQLQRYTNTPKR